MGYEIDFLPVGDGEKCGDAITLRFGNLYGDREEQTVIVIDGGFEKSGEALVNHIKKYYNTTQIDLVVSTHPDSDHISGLHVVLEEIDVNCLWMHQPWNHTDDIAKLFVDGRVTDNSVREKLQKSLEQARSLEKLANSYGIPIIEPFTGLTDNTGCLQVVTPTKEFYEDLLPDFRGTPEPEKSLFGQFIGETTEFVKRIAESLGVETLDDSGETAAENESSVILLLNVDNQYMLFTGDAGIIALNNAIDNSPVSLDP